MKSDSLIGNYFRRASRGYIKFTESPGGMLLPAPDLARTYMLYLHVPYCISLCPFCSFHRVRFRKDAAQHYFQALRQEIEIATDAGFQFGELYIGGGTPTVLPDELVKTINLVCELHPVQGISVETNPGDLTSNTLGELQNAGINRLSVGVQSFDDSLLREMQRFEKYGSGQEIRDRLRGAHGLFDTLNVDMIFNFPHQSESSLRRDLDVLTDELGVDQVSFYPLMAAENTRNSMRRTVGIVDYSRERRLYELIAKRMLDRGYSRNSAWCFSRRPGMIDEYIVEHEQYVGLGSGAFSYLHGRLIASSFSIDHYLRLVDDGRTGMTQYHDMSLRDQMRYYLLMRLFGGSLDIAGAEVRFDDKFRRTLWPEISALRVMGAISESGGILKLTEAGYYVWVMMMREFLNGVNTLRDEMRHGIAQEAAIVPAG